MKLEHSGCRVTAADLSGRQIDTARWLLKAIERRKARQKSLNEARRNG
jgi:uncharacterized protein YecA (UPF0149 family)